ncbi:cytochrome c maturation protein CcmE [Pseudogemmobacter sonorensis]|uniref:cytochrome c maturation protein CcmE n=1 Tax=Pseudogemmobacter sonorensis TaxID=2989681 RepID=UPI00367E6267
MQSTARPVGRPAGFRGLKGLKKQRRIQVVAVAFLAMLAAVVLVGFALKDGINFFRSPSQVLEEAPLETETFRLGGLVKEGSIRPGEGMHFSFTITDGSAEVPVRYVGTHPRPDLFTEGTGTIATGRLVDGVFQATELLAKHDETYMPREVMDALVEQGVYKDPAAAPGG